MQPRGSMGSRLWDSANKALGKLNERITTALERLDAEPRAVIFTQDLDDNFELRAYKGLLTEAQMLHVDLSRESCLTIAEKEAEIKYWKKLANEAKVTEFSLDELEAEKLLSEKAALEASLNSLKELYHRSLEDKNSLAELTKRFDSLMINNNMLRSQLEAANVEKVKNERRNKAVVETLLEEYTNLVQSMELQHNNDIIMIAQLSQSNDDIQHKYDLLVATTAARNNVADSKNRIGKAKQKGNDSKRGKTSSNNNQWNIVNKIGGTVGSRNEASTSSSSSSNSDDDTDGELNRGGIRKLDDDDEEIELSVDDIMNDSVIIDKLMQLNVRSLEDEEEASPPSSIDSDDIEFFEDDNEEESLSTGNNSASYSTSHAPKNTGILKNPSEAEAEGEGEGDDNRNGSDLDDIATPITMQHNQHVLLESLGVVPAAASMVSLDTNSSSHRRKLFSKSTATSNATTSRTKPKDSNGKKRSDLNELTAHQIAGNMMVAQPQPPSSPSSSSTSSKYSTTISPSFSLSPTLSSTMQSTTITAATPSPVMKAAISSSSAQQTHQRHQDKYARVSKDSPLVSPQPTVSNCNSSDALWKDFSKDGDDDGCDVSGLTVAVETARLPENRSGKNTTYTNTTSRNRITQAAATAAPSAVVTKDLFNNSGLGVTITRSPNKLS